MNSTFSPLFRRAARIVLGGLLSLVLVLAAPLGARPAAAESDEPIHTVVTDDVLDVMGLDPKATVVVGRRIPGGPADVLPSLLPSELLSTLREIVDQNVHELTASLREK